MFKLLAFFALLACAFCAPAPEPAPTPAPSAKPGLALAYTANTIPLAYEYRYPSLSYARGYSYGNVAYASYPQYYYYGNPLIL
ncbi:uncharacterized protein [Euwallacea fornicatus]|uniref:uncharacterized protein n=1 Tax=Euwallacea fornicatus TaxID=995702 RepID=UPI00338E9B29